MEIIQDDIVGTVRTFRDSWRNRRALCLLIGSGNGPTGESVRLVGCPRRGGGFTVYYVKSYDPGHGNARAAYEFLIRSYGDGIHVKEVRSDEGIGFHLRMADLGLIASMDVDLYEGTPNRP